MVTTTFDDIHPDIIHNHILPLLDGPSLSATATSSSTLKKLCSDDTLWSRISTSTWPSINHPRVHHLLSTFPSGHRSFFHDSFPALITDVTHRNPRRRGAAPKPDRPSPCNLHPPSHTCPSELISAVDIRYQNDVIYSTVKFTQVTPDFLSSVFTIELIEPDPTRIRPEYRSELRPDPKTETGLTRPIDLTVDEIAGADTETLSHLKDSVTLNWILIDPTRKRTCNLSSVKPVSARQDWVTNETILRYVTVLPGSDPYEIVRCRIQVVLGVGEKGVGLFVKEVVMKVHDLECACLDGGGFLKVVEGAMMEVNGVRRMFVGDDEQRLMSWRMFKEMKKEKMMWEKKMERKKEVVIWFNYVAIFVSFFFSVYFLFLLK